MRFFNEGNTILFRRSFGVPWTITEDRQFWRQVRGLPGLLALRREVARMAKISSRFAAPVETREVNQRLIMLSFVIALSILEAAIGRTARDWPHFFGRFAAELGWDVYSRLELIIEPHGLTVDSMLYDTHGKEDRTHEDHPHAAATPGSAAVPGRAPQNP